MNEVKSKIFIISAPSGAGKSTLIEHLLARQSSLFFSVSHTTRPAREGERDGVEYYFVHQTEFQEMIRAGRFLEWAQVHGHYYGTSSQMLQIARELGKDLILDLDVQGAASIRKILPDAVTIFIMPPSYEALLERLKTRRKDSQKQIAQRLENARREIRFWKDYQFIVINDDIESALEILTSIIRSEGCKSEYLKEKIENIIRSFDVTL